MSRVICELGVAASNQCLRLGRGLESRPGVLATGAAVGWSGTTGGSDRALDSTGAAGGWSEATGAADGWLDPTGTAPQEASRIAAASQKGARLRIPRSLTYG